MKRRVANDIAQATPGKAEAVMARLTDAQKEVILNAIFAMMTAMWEENNGRQKI